MVKSFLLQNWYWVVSAAVSGSWLLFSVFRDVGDSLGISSVQAVVLFNRDGAILFDLRSDIERGTSGVVPQAEILAMGDYLSQKQQIAKCKKGAAVILLCASGIESRKLAARLRKDGLVSVYAVNGGVRSWQESGLPLIKTAI